MQTYQVVIEEASEAADQTPGTETIELTAIRGLEKEGAMVQDSNEGEGELVMRTDETLDDTISVSSMPDLETRLRKLYQQVLDIMDLWMRCFIKSLLSSSAYVRGEGMLSAYCYMPG